MEPKPELEEFFELKNIKETVDMNTLYGFSYVSSVTNDWISYVGSFAYLYGIYTGLNMIGNFGDELDYEGYSFFVLDENIEPINMFSAAIITKEISPHIGGMSNRTVARIDLSFIDGDLPPFDFDY